MSKINQWKEEYREIMEAILELRDQFEGSEMVFDNMVYQIEIDRTVAYCRSDMVDDLKSQLDDVNTYGLEFILTVDYDTLIHVYSDSELVGEPFPILLNEGDELILTSYGTQTCLLDGTCEAIEIVYGDDTYYMAYSNLEELIQ